MFLAVLTMLSGAGLLRCSGQNGGGSAPASLASSCDDVCSNVLVQCGAPSGAVSACLQGCQQLSAVQGTCADKYASYLACLGGATSVTCSPGGPNANAGGLNGGGPGAGGPSAGGPANVGVTLLSPTCDEQLQAYGACSGGPASVSVCVGDSADSAVCASPGAAGPHSLFCVGPPPGCLPSGPGVLGIGSYCCP